MFGADPRPSLVLGVSPHSLNSDATALGNSGCQSETVFPERRLREDQFQSVRGGKRSPGAGSGRMVTGTVSGVTGGRTVVLGWALEVRG